MKFNLSQIMTRAWRLYRESKGSFAECLHRSWISAKAEPVNAARIAEAQAAAGITEQCNTWAGWKALGREVIHGSKGDGAIYKARFFSLSQTQQITATA